VFEVFYIIVDNIDLAYSKIAGFRKKRRKKSCYFVAYLVIIDVKNYMMLILFW